MSSIDLIRMGVKNLWRRKLRTFLTVLGVIIGTSSIIVMLSLGFGLTEGFQEQISQWGDLTTINVHQRWVDPSMPGQEQAKLDDKAVLSFKEIPNVLAVSPTLETYGAVINGRYIAQIPIKGIDPDVMTEFGFETVEGRLLNNTDELAVVFGGGMKHNFWDPNARIWREPKIDLMKDRMSLTLNPNYGYEQPGRDTPNYKEYKIKSVGVLVEGNWETDYGIYMPIKEVQKLIKDKEKSENAKPQRGQSESQYQQINVKVNDMKNVQDVQETIKSMGHEAYSLNDQLESMKQTAGIIQAVLGGIGAISLLVAAIGITNTMVMSIYERTKEIGVMKVIGASLKDIKRLFLFESALIGLLGGILGVIFSYLLSFIINHFGASFMGNFLGTGGESDISIIPIWLVFAAMAFSALIGIMSGYYPARRAMNLSALEAIRTE
ncbi:ABC transporter permease [Tissierella sp. Yu-01]|uniref:ABC transporter permease n=1 Tax=Tissierella sp. Yu-01 TaxID=3035694 RepID=UPI00240DAD13|nr:ABC transporter permease [Tissierella sp. Yu-01]WFA08671.1 ABC transporter permease [Tissierella sp. Yu-01]